MSKETGFTPLDEASLKAILDFKPVENLGQSFLVDPDSVRQLVSLTIADADVVEIGCGPGNLTAGIARIARHVTGLEIFPGYDIAQAEILAGCHNVDIVNIDALKFNFHRWLATDPEAQHQVIGNIPFHISEPLLTILAQVSGNLDNISLMVGDNLADAISVVNPYSDRYTRLSFTASIFDVSKVGNVPRANCWPVPRTNSTLVSMSPMEYPESGSSMAHQLRRKIILSQPENLTIIKVINGFSVDTRSGKVLGKEASHRYDRRQTQQELRQLVRGFNRMPSIRGGSDADNRVSTSRLVDRMHLPDGILSKPFSRLDNQEVRQLAIAIDNL